MADEAKNPEKKIIIDEDWKSQVEREKAEAAREAQQPSQAGAEQASAGAHVPLPLPDLSFLASTLYLQGAIALGLLPNPASNKAEVQLDQAKHVIDLLAMLQQKTEGNRTPDETEELEAILHQLRMAYVGVQRL